MICKRENRKKKQSDVSLKKIEPLSCRLKIAPRHFSKTVLTAQHLHKIDHFRIVIHYSKYSKSVPNV